jgi:hypothetical protein
MNYNELNAHQRDSLINFDEAQHLYTVNNQSLESVTTVVEQCFEQFDAPYWAARKAIPPMTPEMLMAEWEENGRRARDLGTLMHERIENFYLGRQLTDEERSDDTFSLFLRFAQQHHLQPYRTEWRIFYEEYGIAGTLDFLNYDGNEFVIYDWKRSTKLTDAFGNVIKENRYRKYAFAPLQDLPDTTFYHYALQVSIYRYILEQKYGINVSHSKLGVFHPDNGGEFYVIDLPYLREKVITLLESRI